MKPRLHLKDLASVAIQPAPVKEPPAPKAAEPAPAAEATVTPLPSPKPSKRFARSAPTPAHAEAREFSVSIREETPRLKATRCFS